MVSQKLFTAVFAAAALVGAGDAMSSSSRSRRPCKTRPPTSSLASTLILSPSSLSQTASPTASTPSGVTTPSIASSSDSSTPPSIATPSSTVTPDSTSTPSGTSTPDSTSRLETSSTPQPATPESTPISESLSTPEPITTPEPSSALSSTSAAAAASTSVAPVCVGGVNLLVDSSFENSPSGWTIGDSYGKITTSGYISSTVPDGSKYYVAALNAINGQGVTNLWQTIDLEPGAMYRVNGYFGPGTDDTASFCIGELLINSQDVGVNIFMDQGIGYWYQFDKTFTAPAGVGAGSQVRMRTECWDGFASLIGYDNITLKKVCPGQSPAPTGP